MTRHDHRAGRRPDFHVPMRAKVTDPATKEEAERYSERRILLNSALAGNAGAKARLRERGLVRWWHEGRWVIGGPSRDGS